MCHCLQCNAGTLVIRLVWRAEYLLSMLGRARQGSSPTPPYSPSQICLVGSNRFNAFGSHGSDAHVDFGWHASIEACCQELREEKGAQIVGVEIMPSALPVHSFPFRGPTAFMLGNEVRKLYVVGRVDVSQPAVAGPPMPLPPASASQGQGLSERQIRNCDAFIYIPQYGAGTASLNVAVAASIVLHHFALWAGFPERGREGQKFIVAPRPQSARGKGEMGGMMVSQWTVLRKLSLDFHGGTMAMRRLRGDFVRGYMAMAAPPSPPYFRSPVW